MADSSIRAIRQFVYDYVAEMDTVPDRLEKGEDINLEMTIIFDIPEKISQAYVKEMKRLGQRHRRR